MSDLATFYQQQLDTYTQQFNLLKKKSALLSYSRLGCFILICLSVYWLFNYEFATHFILSALVFTVVFLFLVLQHAKIQKEKDWAETLININKEELKAIQGQATSWDNGEHFFEHKSYYLDLDIFGAGSIYHLLNRTGTIIGSTALAQLLKKPLSDKAGIAKQQDAVKDITPNHTFRQHIQAAGLSGKSDKTDIHKINNWAENNEKTAATWWKTAVILSPILIITGIILAAITGIHYLFSGMFLLNLCLVFSFYKKTGKLHNELTGAGKILDQYALIFTIICKNSFQSEKLQTIQTNIQNASTELKRLASLINYFDQRFNLLVAIFFNGLFLYDFWCVLALEKWKAKNAAYIKNWFNEIETIEVLNSLATFAFNNSEYVYPGFTTDGTIIRSMNLAHPLIPAGKSVANPVEFGRDTRVVLITGSNMSGKSTYLRTLGVNMMLASCGAPVCASEFSFMPVKIYTSLRQSDSLQEDTSYFYAELKKLSEIIHQLENGQQALVVLDEVLKGTNSDDKTYGSAELIKRLQYFNSLTLIATHDIALGEMEKNSDGRIANFCFESTIVNNELLFDYKLHKGVAINKNATFLMKKMGIIG